VQDSTQLEGLVPPTKPSWGKGVMNRTTGRSGYSTLSGRKRYTCRGAGQCPGLECLVPPTSLSWGKAGMGSMTGKTWWVQVCVEAYIICQMQDSNGLLPLLPHNKRYRLCSIHL
jgi:hypothetical protein